MRDEGMWFTCEIKQYGSVHVAIDKAKSQDKPGENLLAISIEVVGLHRALTNGHLMHLFN